MPLEPKIPIAAITDEFSPNLQEALLIMQEIGMSAAELRVVNGRNIMDLDPTQLAAAKASLDQAGLPVIGIASPLLKCVLPGAPAIDSRFQHDVFASSHTYEDQDRLAAHAFELAHFFGTRLIRVFSFWRTLDPSACHSAILDHLLKLANAAAKEDLIIGLENEHACNIGTATEAAQIFSSLVHPHLQLVWDPANALVAGEDPMPGGYGRLAVDRIAHVHAKDCHMEGPTPVWGPLGTRSIRWKEQVAALLADNYRGFLSLETHWSGPGGNKLEASRICGWNLKGLAAA